MQKVTVSQKASDRKQNRRMPKKRFPDTKEKFSLSYLEMPRAKVHFLLSTASRKRMCRLSPELIRAFYLSYE